MKELKHFISQVVILIIFILSALCFYLAVKVAFFSSFINVMLIIIAIFFLIVACGEIDRIHGFGKYSGTTESQSESQSKPQPPTSTNKPHDHTDFPHKEP